MTVYVDPLMHHGWVLRGRTVQSCHMLTDDPTLAELHAVARRIGCSPRWLHWPAPSAPHYDLTASRRADALGAGAIEITPRGDEKHRAIWKALMAQWRAPNAGMVDTRTKAGDRCKHLVLWPHECSDCQADQDLVGWPKARA